MKDIEDRLLETSQKLLELGFSEVGDGIYKNCCMQTEKAESVSADTTDVEGIKEALKKVKEGWEKLVESINDVLTVDGGADMIDKKTLQDTKKSQPIKVQVPHEANNLGSNLVSHLRVCDRLNEIYASKNKDYGNSFGEQYQEYGITSSVIRLDDKMRRLKQITKSGAKVEDETIEDTLLDLANYAILTLMELEGQDE